MATQEEEGTGAAAAHTVVGLALRGSKSSDYVLQWALAKFAKDDDGNPAPTAFKLIHVLTPVLAVPTPMGNRIPIDDTREEIAHDYQKAVWIKKQKMLVRCKDACDENKVEAQVLLVEGTNVVDTISSLVDQYQIQILVVGNPSSNSIFTRISSGSRTSSLICKSLPSFCTAYIVSKDELSSVYASGSEIGPPSGSVVPKGNSGSSSTEEFTDATCSRSALDDTSGRGMPGFPSLPCSNLASENLESSSSIGSFNIYDYLDGNASVYADKDRRVTSCTGAESSISSQLQGSDKVPKENSLLGLMLSDNKGSDKVPKENSLLELLLKDKKYDVSTELEKLRIELTHIQYESVDASHQVNALATRRMEVEAQLRKIQTRVDKATDDVQEEMAHRLAAEELATRVKDLVRVEVMKKNRLLAKVSKDADRKSRLENLLDTKWRRATEQINLLEGKLQQAVNEHVKLKVKQNEDSKLWEGLDLKTSSIKTLWQMKKALAENHKQELLEKILKLESDNQELQSQMQSVLEAKCNDSESLQRDITKRDHQVDTLGNQINQLCSVLNEEKTLEAQKLQVERILQDNEHKESMPWSYHKEELQRIQSQVKNEVRKEKQRALLQVMGQLDQEVNSKKENLTSLMKMRDPIYGRKEHRISTNSVRSLHSGAANNSDRKEKEPPNQSYPGNTATVVLDRDNPKASLRSYKRAIRKARAWCRSTSEPVDLSAHFGPGAEVFTTPANGTFHLTFQYNNRSLTLFIYGRDLYVKGWHSEKNGMFQIVKDFIPDPSCKFVDIGENYHNSAYVF